MKYLIYRLLWHIAPLFKKGLFIHFDLEINNSCNQRCIFCWHSRDDRGFVIDDMFSNTVFFNIQKARQMGARSIKFNLRGEPLLNKKLLHYVVYAKKLGYVDIMINTNGVLLDIETFRELEIAGLTTCIISVDSFDEETYCMLHGVDSRHFRTLQANLLKLRIHKQNSRNSKCKIIFNIHRNKLNQFEDFSGMVPLFYPIKLKIRNTMNRKGRHISLDKPRKRKKHCPHMKRRLTMLTSGKVYPCCIAYDEPEDIELVEGFLADKWDSEKRLILLDNYAKGLYTETCKNCTSRDIYK